MNKKIVLWVVYAGVVGLLVFGAINRTEAKAEAGNGESRSIAKSQADQTNSQNNLVSGKGGGNSQGQGRNAVLEDESTREEKAEDHEHSSDSLFGTVQSITAESMAIELSAGEILVIEGQAWRYALTNGFETAVGNSLEMTGFFEDGEFKVSWIRDNSLGLEIEVRDPGGRPKWAGGRSK
jgi:hypothetical protein